MLDLMQQGALNDILIKEEVDRLNRDSIAYHNFQLQTRHLVSSSSLAMEAGHLRLRRHLHLQNVECGERPTTLKDVTPSRISSQDTFLTLTKRQLSTVLLSDPDS